MTGSPPELSTTLAKRFECLAALVDQPRTKSELDEVLDYSRSTLDRAIRDLRDVNLVAYEDGIWKPTFLGQGAFHIRSQYLETLDEMIATASVLDPLPVEGPVGCAILDGAIAHEAPTSVPDAVMSRVLDYVEGKRTLCLVTPRLVLGFAEELYERVAAAGEFTLELIIPQAMFEEIMGASPQFAETLLDDPNVDLYQATIPFSFGLWIVDRDHVGLIVFTERGVSGLLVNDTDRAIDWAEEQCRRVKEDARPIFRRGTRVSVQC